MVLLVLKPTNSIKDVTWHKSSWILVALKPSSSNAKNSPIVAAIVKGRSPFTVEVLALHSNIYLYSILKAKHQFAPTSFYNVLFGNQDFFWNFKVG